MTCKAAAGEAPTGAAYTTTVETLQEKVPVNTRPPTPAPPPAPAPPAARMPLWVWLLMALVAIELMGGRPS